MEALITRLRPLARLLPAGLNDTLRGVVRDWQLRRAVERIAALPPGQLPTRQMLEELRAGWGNMGYAARPEYLQELMNRAVNTSGPILECGSGVSTLLLGLLAGRRGVETWTLEHMPEWHARVSGALERTGIPNVHNCLAPIQDRGGYSWYTPPVERMPRAFQLIICDGPPGNTPGGRYGLWPVLGERLAPGAVILLDDAERPGEEEVLQRWSKEASMRVDMRRVSGGAYAVITRS
ncbi:class I SAM-dependent methyltransferase [Archangium violaceum]|uniref:class I SAM-dependent methyltransferase n=1 Tax=Archangium violaceum TaxID=83451 RepID=UPI00193B209B|nr:class I SAM-dependent methyltransferase [Archangium violaceum]QRK12717.1 class I SAM-dependent methyltransferase [Archangium violaceum]